MDLLLQCGGKRFLRRPEPGHLGGVRRFQQIHLHRQLFAGRLPFQLLHHMPLSPGEPVDGLHHMDGDADRPGLVGDRPADRLADPPGGVRAEFIAQDRIEFFHRAQQTEVAFLHQIQKGDPAADVPFGDTHYQPQIRADQRLVRLLHAVVDGFQRRFQRR